MIHRQLLYPFFLNICPITQLEFWKNTFDDLAYGITITNCYINNNVLICDKPGHSFNYKITKTDPSLYLNIYNLLNDDHILTDNEKKLIDMNKQTTYYLDQQDGKWLNIKRRRTKDIIIEKFILQMKTQHNLSLKQTKLVLTIITIAILFKSITNNDIEYNNDTITSISGINFSYQNFNIIKNIYNTTSIIFQEPITTSYKLCDYWLKYIETLQ